MASRAHGSTGPKRTGTQRDRDQHRIAHLHALGHNQKEISAILAEETRDEGYAISEVQVGKDLRAVKARWERENMEAIWRRRNQQQARLDGIILEAARGWRRSGEARRETTAHRMEKLGQVRRANGSTDTVLISGEQRTMQREIEALPDPRYLAVILDAARREAKLWGLDVRPEEAGVAGTGTPAPAPKQLPYEAANALLASLAGVEIEPPLEHDLSVG